MLLHFLNPQQTHKIKVSAVPKPKQQEKQPSLKPPRPALFKAAQLITVY